MPLCSGSLPLHEGDTDSTDSSGSIDDGLDTKSLASSVRDYEFSNGRRYHAYHAGAYLIPNDNLEIARERILHHIWKEMLSGRLYNVTLEEPKRILDIGTGSGLWAVEMADQFPDALVVGNDLSPIQPEWVPENCHFYVDDFEDDWDHGIFDYIHGRHLMGTVKDWPRFYKHAFENLTPGGQIEIQEVDAWVHSQRTGSEPAYVMEWNRSLNKAFAKWGKALNVADNHAQWMRDAGFEDVKDEIFLLPIGTWAKDPRLKEIGRFHLAGAISSVDSYSLQIMTEIVGQSVEETAVSSELIKAEMRQKKFRFYGRYHFVSGRRPVSA